VQEVSAKVYNDLDIDEALRMYIRFMAAIWVYLATMHAWLLESTIQASKVAWKKGDLHFERVKMQKEKNLNEVCRVPSLIFRILKKKQQGHSSQPFSVG